MTDKFEIKELKKTDSIPYDLLILADPSKNQIDKYVFESVIFTLTIGDSTIGCYVLFKPDEDRAEIKNISILTNYQGKGYGTILLQHAIDHAKSCGCRKVVIGTGNSSIGQLYLYQKVGFRITQIIRDFFTENYETPIIENGIECRDMIVLTQDL